MDIQVSGTNYVIAHIQIGDVQLAVQTTVSVECKLRPGKVVHYYNWNIAYLDNDGPLSVLHVHVFSG